MAASRSKCTPMARCCKANGLPISERPIRRRCARRFNLGTSSKGFSRGERSAYSRPSGDSKCGREPGSQSGRGDKRSRAFPRRFELKLNQRSLRSAERANQSAAKSIDLGPRVEEPLCSLQISGAEPLGKSVVDRLEERCGFSGTALIPQQASKARGGAEFPGQRTLPARPVWRLSEEVLRRLRGWRTTLQ
jgi:hypothetical protein